MIRRLSPSLSVLCPGGSTSTTSSTSRPPSRPLLPRSSLSPCVAPSADRQASSYTLSSLSMPPPRSFPGPLTSNQHTSHMTAGLSQLTPLVADRAQGSWIFNKEGKKYLDFCCGIGVTNLGHCHPKVNAAAAAPAV